MSQTLEFRSESQSDCHSCLCWLLVLTSYCHISALPEQCGGTVQSRCSTISPKINSSRDTILTTACTLISLAIPQLEHQHRKTYTRTGPSNLLKMSAVAEHLNSGTPAFARHVYSSHRRPSQFLQYWSSSSFGLAQASIESSSGSSFCLKSHAEYRHPATRAAKQAHRCQSVSALCISSRLHS